MLRREKYFAPEGCRLIAGLDESGRGPLAGPVVTAAVIIPDDISFPGLDDSKRLKPNERNRLFDLILTKAVGFSVDVATAEEIDHVNILEATKRSSYRALSKLQVVPDFILTDALKLERLTIRHLPIIKGDQSCRAIAAASIIAKVYRDRLMCAYHREFPQYGFGEHKGYGTKSHLDALERHGPSTIHRLSFHGICWFQHNLIYSRTFSYLKRRIDGFRGNQAAFTRLETEIGGLAQFLPAREIKECRGLLKSCPIAR